MKKIAIFLFAILSMLIVKIPAYAQEKTSVVNLSKEYSQVKFTITAADISNMETTIESPKGKTYESSVVDNDTVECIVAAKEGEFVEIGEWKVNVSNDKLIEQTESEQEDRAEDDSPNDDDETSDTSSDDMLIPDIGNVKVVVEGSMEKIVEADRDIVIATDIVGLKMYFRDDTFVAQWTDTSCGDVEIKVTNAGNMQVLDTKTINGNTYELDIDETSVKEIFVDIVPTVSKNIDGATSSYDIDVYNHPEGEVIYEDIDITNRDEITATVTLNKAYSCEIWNNGKLQETTPTLDPGTYDLNLKTEVGDNNFLVYIIDDIGNKRSTAKYLEKDVIAPYLQLVREYIDILTQEQTITIEGKVEEQDYLRINDKDIEVEGDHTFKYDYKLKEGLNEINIEAGDRAGNIQSYLATVTYFIPTEDPVDIRIIIASSALGITVLILLIVFIIKKKGHRGDGGNDADEKIRKKNAKKKREPFRISIRRLIDILVPVVTFIIILTCMVTMTVIPTSSMEPTIMTGSTVFFNKLAYVRSPIERGDIVLYWSDESNALLVKRVIGMPQDEISFMDGYVCINGVFADESAYLPADVETNCTKKFTVPENSYFMLGDNREDSFDSRYFENPYIKADDIRGKFLGQIKFN